MSRRGDKDFFLEVVVGVGVKFQRSFNYENARRNKNDPPQSHGRTKAKVQSKRNSNFRLLT